VIVAAWVLTFIYVNWANRVYDPALAALRSHHEVDDAAARRTNAAPPTERGR
jgi:hypothetical protein